MRRAARAHSITFALTQKYHTEFSYQARSTRTFSFLRSNAEFLRTPQTDTHTLTYTYTHTHAYTTHTHTHLRTHTLAHTHIHASTHTRSSVKDAPSRKSHGHI